MKQDFSPLAPSETTKFATYPQDEKTDNLETPPYLRWWVLAWRQTFISEILYHKDPI